jgi:hypothetical protein
MQEFVVDVAQLVRAPGCGPGGRGFNSRHSPQDLITIVFLKEYVCARSSTDRAVDFGSEGCRFESCRARHAGV